MRLQQIKTSVDKSMVWVMTQLDGLHQRWFFKAEEWPVVSGQFYVGQKDSPVAVCTLSSLDLMRKIGRRDEIAIIGKTFTENLGIEKMIRNIVTNPSIRFLILCGRESPHRVGQSLIALKEHGVDTGGRIIQSLGILPVIKNVAPEEITAFRQQIEIFDLIGEVDMDAVLTTVQTATERKPGRFSRSENVRSPKNVSSVEQVKCWHRESQDYHPDPAGFFVIHIDTDKREIVVEHYSNEFELLRVLHGKNALEICSTIIRNDWVAVAGHAAYLGRELGKAELALKRGWLYEQNKGLIEHEV
jgi:tetrahydromethanopterin S-methyltransferase subunit A